LCQPITQTPESPRQTMIKRASKACYDCRARKVRCDAAPETPCRNCVVNNVECHLPKGQSNRSASFRILKFVSSLPTMLECR
jgi:hypothetical protein